MSSEFARFVSSDIVEVLANRGESRFFVHKDILTSQSAPFRDALTGEWKEASEGKIDLGDWDGATVGQMVQFLYRGSYHYPSPTPISTDSSPDSSPAETKIEPVCLKPLVASDESPFDATRPLTPVKDCLRRFLSVPEENDEPVVTNLEGRYNYGDALLSHAKVYHLAHYKAIEALRMQALKHLLDLLSRIDPMEASSGSDNAEGIVGLARYVYDNTDHLENHEEPLRRLLSHFIASNYSALRSTSDLAKMLGEGGDLVVDVMDNLYRGTSDALKPNCSDSGRIRYISKINVTCGAMPRNYLHELNGTSAKLDWEFGNQPIWLYAEYTSVPDDACTEIKFQIGNRNKPGPDTLDMGYARQIVCKKDLAVKQKITAAALLRGSSTSLAAIPAKYGTFNGMTEDIAGGFADCYVYIVWKSALTL